MLHESRETTTTIAGDVPVATVKAWMERLPELIKGYLPEGILNMDKLGYFSRHCHIKVFLKR